MFKCWLSPSLIVIFHFAEIAQLTSYDSGIAETPETDDSVSVSSFETFYDMMDERHKY